MTDWNQLLRAFEFLLWIAVGLYTWQANRHRVTQEHVSKLERQLEDAERSLAVHEERLKHVPTSVEFQDLKGDVRVLLEKQQGAQDQLSLIRQTLEMQIAALRSQNERIDTFLRREFT